MPEFRTRTGVEIARVGNYDLQSGPWTFTRDNLASAVANQAGFVPRIKLGHTDPRFDGEPSLGRVQNMRLADDGDALVADLVDVPAWLAESLGGAYPGRSIEASASKDTGDMQITALALLGVAKPGIDTLADLEIALAAAAAERPSDPDVVQGAVSVTQLRASGLDPQDPTAAVPASPNERSHMDENVRRALAAAHGLDPDTATEDQVNQAVIAAEAPLAPAPAPTPEPAPAPTVPAPVTFPEPTPAPEPAPAEPVAPVQVEDPVRVAAAAQIETLSSEVAAVRAELADRKEKEIGERRDIVAASWRAEGRITDAEQSYYRGLLDIDEEATTKLAASLSAGRVPVLARSINTVTSSPDDDNSTGWFPGLKEN